MTSSGRNWTGSIGGPSTASDLRPTTTPTPMISSSGSSENSRAPLRGGAEREVAAEIDAGKADDQEQDGCAEILWAFHLQHSCSRSANTVIYGVNQYVGIVAENKIARNTSACLS